MTVPLDDDDVRRDFDLSLWRELWSYTRPYRREVWVLMLFGCLTAFLDAGLPLVTRSLIDDVVERPDAVNWLGYGALYAALVLGMTTSVLGFIRFGGRIRTHVGHDLRQAGFENLQRLSFSFFDRRPVGWLVARMTSDCERLTNILAWGVLDFAFDLTLMTAVGAALFFLDPRLALVSMAVVPVLLWVSLRFKRRILDSSRAIRKTNSRITATFAEAISGVRTAKVFAREDAHLTDFRDMTGTMRARSMENALQNALYLPIVLTLGSLATGLALAFGGLSVHAGGLSLGTLIAFLTYTRYFFQPVGELAHWFAELQMAQASAERVVSLVRAEPEIGDSEVVRAALARAESDPPASGLAPDGHPDRIGEIEFRDVGFRYTADTPVVDGLDLRVSAGETIALVGPTGGGKTTFVHLLARFYEPTRGSIHIDGVDYRERSLEWLQSNLGIVLQTPHLFSGTITDNIRYGRLDATDEEVVEAARRASAHEFVTAFERGYDTVVGESGVRLSLGEKQLVSLARVLLADPRILILDEATSSVDTPTERRIQSALDVALQGRTAFVIAHRLSTIRAADRILVIEHGRIAEQGSHEALMEIGGAYRRLYARSRQLAHRSNSEPDQFTQSSPR